MAKFKELGKASLLRIGVVSRSSAEVGRPFAIDPFLPLTNMLSILKERRIADDLGGRKPCALNALLQCGYKPCMSQQRKPLRLVFGHLCIKTGKRSRYAAQRSMRTTFVGEAFISYRFVLRPCVFSLSPAIDTPDPWENPDSAK